MTKKLFQLAIIMLLLASCNNNVKVKEFKSPDEEYGELFKDVQLSSIYPDSKTFTDAIPIGVAADILKLYETEKNQKGFSLASFVKEHFQLPENHGQTFVSDTNKTVEAHINALWPILTREPGDNKGSIIPLRKTYLVPGGRFREVYYWDSYFTMLGLREAGEIDLIENMVTNFAQLIQDLGHIPNGNRTYYLSRSQPPFFALMVELLAEAKKDDQVYVRYLPQMQKEYQYWMSSRNKEESVAQTKAKEKGDKAFLKVYFAQNDNLLNRYYDESNTPRPEAYKEDIATAAKSKRPKEEVYRHLRSAAESGWDFSSRWFKDAKNLESIHTTDILPVDLNALLYKMELILEKAYQIQGKTEYAASFKALSAKRKGIFDQYFWNEKAGFYYDYDFVSGKQTTVKSMAAAFPLFCGLASRQQAEKVAQVLEKEFLKPGGFSTTLVDTKQQWDAPNGWAPLQWVAIKGLRQYGQNALATKAKDAWVKNNIRVYKNTGKLTEKYNVMDISLMAGGGEYPVQDGFGWTNGVLLKLIKE